MADYRYREHAGRKVVLEDVCEHRIGLRNAFDAKEDDPCVRKERTSEGMYVNAGRFTVLLILDPLRVNVWPLSVKAVMRYVPNVFA